MLKRAKFVAWKLFIFETSALLVQSAEFLLIHLQKYITENKLIYVQKLDST